jgi:endonuclease/exonuclease/phosphatase family metal-dependent hydrolase
MSHLRVMTFNVLQTLLGEEDIEHHSDIWANRAEFNIQTVRRYDPDIIGLQEFDEGHWGDYQEKFPEYEHDVFDSLGNLTSNPLLWKADRFERVDAGTFWLTRTPNYSTPDWGLDYALSVQWSLLRLRENGIPILVANTQYEDGPGGEQMRDEGTGVLIDQLHRITARLPGVPALLMGDFNCNPWSPAYRQLLASGFVDTYRAAGHGDSADSSTFHGFQGQNYFALEWGGSVFWRVDWVLVRGGIHRVQTTSCSIVRDQQPPVYASDHYPVVAELLIE